MDTKPGASDALAGKETPAASALNSALVQDSLTERVFKILIEAIERGELPPGSRLREAALARQLGISRGPLREALRRLEGRKLLEYMPNIGMRVANPSIEDLISIFEMREALEGMACRLATLRMTDAEFSQLESLLETHRHSADLKDGAAYYQQAGDLDFHYRIAAGSRNTRIVDLLCKDLYHFVRIHRYRSSALPGRATIALDEHKAILEAMRSRDPNRAEAAMRAHIQQALQNLQRSADMGNTDAES